MYRYGVFEEQGYESDPVYPMCYHDDQAKEARLTGCSDLPITDYGICDGSTKEYNVSKMVHEKARSSIMFAAEAPSISMFCDEGNHNRYAPTKHNLICQRKSTFEVIITHEDFASNTVGSIPTNEIRDTRPRISYKKQNTTRYVLVIENTRDMTQRETWNFLKKAVRKWTTFDLPDNTEIGMVLTSDTDYGKFLDIVSLKNPSNRDKIFSELLYVYGDSPKHPCMPCALKKAQEMLVNRSKTAGPASNVIILVAPGVNTNKELENTVKDIKKSKIRIVTINYPTMTRTSSLDFLAKETNGKAYTVAEKKLNVDTSNLETYFQLSNVFYDIIETYHSGVPNDLMVEIYRREIKSDNYGRNSITGSFLIDENLGEPAQFMIYVHNMENPLLKGFNLTSPSHQTFTSTQVTMNIVNIFSQTNISEPGIWTYTVEPFPGNPQPHFLQVMATPKQRSSPVVRAKFRMHRNQPGWPLVLLTEVKYGNYPVLGAKVEVIASKIETNGSVVYMEKLELLDTGSGDPDVTRGDGIYSRYFSAATGGAGEYTFEVTVTDNGNTAYASQDSSVVTGEFTTLKIVFF